jgi:hypothetical protein
MALIQNSSGGEIRLSRVGKIGPPKLEGVNIAFDDTETATVPDDFLRSDGMVALVAANDITILQFGAGDEVVEQESLHRSAYSISLDNTPADIANIMVAAVDTGGAETYDFSNPANRSLSMVLNGISVTHTFVSGDFSDQAAATAAEVVTSLAGNAAFAAEAAADDNAGSIRVTSLAFGTSSNIIFSGTANAILALSVTQVDGTIAPSLVQVLVKDSRGNAIQGVDVVAGIWDTVTGGSLLADTQIQEASKGSIKTGKYTNTATLTTSSTGEADVEVASDISGADSLFLDLAAPAGFFLSVSDRKGVDSSREQIDKSA